MGERREAEREYLLNKEQIWHKDLQIKTISEYIESGNEKVLSPLLHEKNSD